MNQRAHHGFLQVIARFVLVPVLLGCAALSALLGVSVRAASAPNIVNYQGRILNTNGVPVASASASMIFELYDSLAGGTCLWSNSSATCASATARTVTLTDGLFSEPLGDTTVGVPYAAISDTIFGANAGVYLKVTVNGEALSPRKQIVAAPYALNADTLDGFDSSSFVSLFTDGGATTYLTDVADDFAVGGTTAAASPFGVDESADTVYIGEGSVANGTLVLKASDGDTAQFLINTSDTIVFSGGNVEITDDFAVTGGDLTSTSATFNLLDAAGNSSTIEIGGVSTDLANTVNIATDSTSADTIVIGSTHASSTAQLRGATTDLNGTSVLNLNDASGTKTTDIGGVSNSGTDTVNIATNSTAADVITIGNSNASTTVAVTGGDDWSITAGGVATFGGTTTVNAATFLNSAVHIDGGSLQSTSGTFDFLDTTGNSGTIDIGGVTTNLGNTVNIATNSTTSDAITIGNSNASTVIDITGGNDWQITSTGFMTLAGDLDVDGGDLRSTSGTFNFLDSSGNSTTVDIGGVTADLGNAISIATNSTTPDTISIGNANTTTTVALTGGDDWSITSAGVATFSSLYSNSFDRATAGALTFGNTNATSVSICSSAACDTLDLAQGSDADAINLATDATSGDAINMGNSNASTTFDITGGSRIQLDSATAVYVNDGSGTRTVNIGGVLIDGASTVSIATNSTSADTITIGNSNASTVVTVTGGDDWSITSAGLATFSNLFSNSFDRSTAGALAIGNTNATSISECNSAACDTYSLATNADADVLNIGDSLDTLNLDAGTVTASGDWTWTQGDGENIGVVQTRTVDATLHGLVINGTYSAAASTGENYFALFQNSDDGGATGTPDGFFRFYNEDTNEAMTYGLLLESASGGITVGVDATDTDIATALAVGTNDISGTSGNIDFTSFDMVGSTGNVTTAGDLAVNGGDLTSSSGTFNIMDNTGDATTIDIGGYDTSFSNTIHIATNATASDNIFIGNMHASTTLDMYGGNNVRIQGGTIYLAETTSSSTVSVGAIADTAVTINMANEATTADTLNFGNSNAATLFTLTGGDDWSITSGGVATFGGTTTVNAATFLNSGVQISSNITSLSGTFDFLDATSNSLAIDIGGNDTNIGNTVRIATNATTADTVTIGSENASSVTNIKAGTVGINDSVGVATTINIGTGSAFADDVNIGNTNGSSDITVLGDGISLHANSLISINNFAGSNATYIGGVSVNGSDNVQIAVDSNSSDILTFGNTNTSTTFEIFGGDDWSIATTGDATFEDITADFNGTATTNGVCHSGADSDTTASARALVVCSAAPDDYAEWYETDGSAGAGDIVATTSSTFTYEAKQSNPFTGQILAGSVTKTLPVLTKATSGSADVFGIVSTSPNQVIGSDVKNQGAHPQPIGLVGRVPLHVTSENGPITAGDYLTVSSTPGYAMKATAPGRVVGRALTSFSGVGMTTITAFIDNSWYGGEMLAADGSAQGITGDLQLSSLAAATASAPASTSHALLLTGSAWDGSTSVDATMGLRTRVNSLSNYRLAFENTLGGEVASITNSGDILVSGKLFPSDRGLTQTDAYIFYDSSAGGGYMKTNAAGWNVGSYDFAEMFPSDESLAAGEVVVFADRSQAVKKSGTTTYDNRLIGVVSTRPGFLAGEYKAGSYPIALSGRVPTNVSDENGAVAIGDPLTTSSTPGVAMKATKAGPILGYAMEPLAAGSSKIIAFIRASYYSGSGTVPAPDASNTVSGISTASNLDLSGTLNMNGGNILSVGSIEGIGGAWKIAENGDFTTKGEVVKQVRSFMGDLVNTYPATTTERTVELSGTTTLQNGAATITFSQEDSHFSQIISNTASYRVLVTPAGATGQVYVTDRSNGGFIIHDTGSSTGVMVDWLVIAYEKDHEPAVIEPLPAPAPEPVVAGATDPALVDGSTLGSTPTTDPVLVDAPVDPPPADPIVADPPPTDPVPPADPVVTDPPLTDPAPTDPAPTDPLPTTP